MTFLDVVKFFGILLCVLVTFYVVWLQIYFLLVLLLISVSWGRFHQDLESCPFTARFNDHPFSMDLYREIFAPVGVVRRAIMGRLIGK
jgi:hypothetical protein